MCTGVQPLPSHFTHGFGFALPFAPVLYGGHARNVTGVRSTAYPLHCPQTASFSMFIFTLFPL